MHEVPHRVVVDLQAASGKLGQYTIGADGEIVLGPPTVFNAANIDQFNF